MRRFWLFIKYWLPPLLWMSLIFAGSADAASVNRSSRIIGPLLHWLFPSLSEAAVGTCVLVARKCAHLAEYGLCTILVWRALRKPVRNDPRPWSWREPKWALLIVFLYACTDELHQAFVPGRGPSPVDVVLDTLGAAFAMLLVWRLSKLNQPRRYQSSSDSIESASG